MRESTPGPSADAGDFPDLDLFVQRKVCDRLVVGTTGAIAAAVLPLFIVLARRSFAPTVRVVMTRSAKRFVTPYALHVASGFEPIVDLFRPTRGALVPHIDVTADADLFVVIPTTANMLARVAGGFADDPVSTAVLAARCPVVFVPAMNEAMWRRPAVQRNVAQLGADGYHVMEPGPGIEIATMETSSGGIPDLRRLLTYMAAVVSTSPPRPAPSRPELRR